MIEIDRVLAKCGDFHRYQLILLGLFCIINLLSSMHYYSQTIISFVPEHWCYDYRLVNLSLSEIRIAAKNLKISSCSKEEVQGDALKRYDCNEWIYIFDYGYQSMTCELNWICGDSWKSTLGQSMFFVGSVVGSLGFGILADIIGRVPVLILANITAFVGNSATIFGTTVISFAILRFISGLATDSNFMMMYILVMEYIRPSMRTTGLSICIGLFYCLGSVITPWIAVYLGHWKMFLLVSSAPLLMVPLFYFIVPESAEWLMAKKKYDKAVDCFKKIAKINNKHVDDIVYQEFIRNCSTEIGATKTQPNMLDLFKTPRLRRNTLILFFKSMVITLCYDAISRNVQGLGISPFVMFSLSASAILPACIVLILLQDIIGRKAMASSSLFLSGTFTSATGLIIVQKLSDNDPLLVASLAVIGRFGVTIAYNSAAQYATELIPTCVRGQGVAAVHVAGYAVTFFSSYILLLAQYFKPLPELILGMLSLMGAVLCLFLPETLNRTLPCTLESGEEFGRGEKFLDFSCFDKKKTTSTITLTES